VEWDVPTVNPSCVKGYDATCYETFQNSSYFSHNMQDITLVRKSNSATMAGLAPCTSYTCEVRALGEAHWESEFESVETRTETAKMDAPTDVGIISISETKVTLSWSCPLYSCRCVNMFLIHWSLPNTTIFGEQVVEKTEEETTILDLLPCSEYLFSIRTVAEDGSLGNEALLQVNTLDAAPGPVERLSTTNVGQDEFTARWQIPSQNPQCVSGYRTTVSAGICQIKSLSKEEKSKPKASWEYYSAQNLTCDSCYLLQVSPESSTGLLGSTSELEIFTEEC